MADGTGLGSLRRTLPWQVVELLSMLGSARNHRYLLDEGTLADVFSRYGLPWTEALASGERAVAGLSMGANMRSAFTPQGADHSTWFAITDAHRIGAFASLCGEMSPDAVLGSRREHPRHRDALLDEDSVVLVTHCNPEVRLGASGRVYLICMNDMDVVDYGAHAADSTARYVELVTLLRTAMFWPPSELDPLRWHIVYCGDPVGEALAGGLAAEASPLQDSRSGVWYRGNACIVEQRIAGFAESTKVMVETPEEAVEVVQLLQHLGVGCEWWSPVAVDPKAMVELGPADRALKMAGHNILCWGRTRDDTYDYGRQRAHWSVVHGHGDTR